MSAKIYALFATANGLDCLEFLGDALPLTGVIGLSADRARGDVSGHVDIEDRLSCSALDILAVDDYQLRDQADRAQILSRDIDVLLVLGWQRLIPQWLIDHCRVGAIGNHGSADGISGGRGRSPQNWALLTGRDAFEVSIFWIDPGIDSGIVIDTRRFTLESHDDIRTSHYKTAYWVADMLRENWQSGRLLARAGQEQADAEASYLPQRRPEDGEIDWNRSAEEISDFVRALTRPYPGAFSLLDGKTVHFWRVRPFVAVVPMIDPLPGPGQILAILSHGEIVIQTGKGTLLVDEWSTTDKTFSPEPGNCFSSVDFHAQIDEILRRHREKYPNLPIAKTIGQLANGRA